MKNVPRLAEALISRLRELEPEIADSFFPTATERVIRRLETTTKATVPAGLRAFWRTYDGQDLNSFGIFDGDFLFLSAEGALDDWAMKKKIFGSGGKWEWYEAPPQVRAEVWNPGWIPFAWAPTGDTICVDLAPTKVGKAGQVIMTGVATDYRALLSKSFEDWLENLVADLRFGRFSRDPKCPGGLLHERPRPRGN